MKLNIRTVDEVVDSIFYSPAKPDLTTVEEAVEPAKPTSEIIEQPIKSDITKYAANGVYFFMHPFWGGFANYGKEVILHDNSDNLMVNYLKQDILDARKYMDSGTLHALSNALVTVNQFHLFSAFQKTKPLVILLLPKDYDKEQMHPPKDDGSPSDWRFPEAFVELIKEKTGEADNYLACETKDYDHGYLKTEDWIALNFLFTKLKVMQSYIIGDNIGQCIGNFIPDAKSELPDTKITGIADLCITPFDHFIINGKLPNGYSFSDYEKDEEVLKNKYFSDRTSIAHYNFDDIARLVYSDHDLHHLVLPSSKKSWDIITKDGCKTVQIQDKVHILSPDTKHPLGYCPERPHKIVRISDLLHEPTMQELHTILSKYNSISYSK
ncbi:MAG: hypothetical protein ABIC04_01200 [Nanoarchaeota archaeon]